MRKVDSPFRLHASHGVREGLIMLGAHEHPAYKEGFSSYRKNNGNWMGKRHRFWIWFGAMDREAAST